MEFKAVEEKSERRQRFLFYGAAGTLFSGATNANSALAPIFRNLRSPRMLVAEPAAARLVDLGIQHYSGERNPAGYPIFVYRIDADGIRRTRVVNKGDAVTFTPQEE